MNVVVKLNLEKGDFVTIEGRTSGVINSIDEEFIIIGDEDCGGIFQIGSPISQVIKKGSPEFEKIFDKGEK